VLNFKHTLGTDSVYVVKQIVEKLGLSESLFLNKKNVTHASIRTSDISKNIFIFFSSTYRSFRYHKLDYLAICYFGELLKPRYIFDAKKVCE